MTIESSINTQNSEINEMSDFISSPIVCGSKLLTRKLSQLFRILFANKRDSNEKIFAPTYAKLTMRCYENQIFSIICQSYALVSKNFENSWFRFLCDCQILLKVNLIKSDHLLSMLNQINNNTQFTLEKSQTRLPSLDIMINKSGTKVWMDIYNKPTGSKKYVPFT